MLRHIQNTIELHILIMKAIKKQVTGKNSVLIQWLKNRTDSEETQNWSRADSEEIQNMEWSGSLEHPGQPIRMTKNLQINPKPNFLIRKKS